MIVAYMYWMRKDDSFGYENFEKHYIDTKAESQIVNLQNFEQERVEVESAITHFELQRGMESEHLGDVLSALDKKFK